jgi:hypothetical protein
VSEKEIDPEEGDTPLPPPPQPVVFTTKSQLKRAHKKREKLARRAARCRLGPTCSAAGSAPGSSGAQTLAKLRLGKDEDPQYMVVETSLSFGSFERHTTGAPLSLRSAVRQKLLVFSVCLPGVGSVA